MWFHLKRAISNIFATPIVTLVTIFTLSSAIASLVMYQAVNDNLAGYIDYRISRSAIAVYVSGDENRGVREYAMKAGLRIAEFTRADALDIFAERYPDEAQLLRDMENNPLPATYLLHLNEHSLLRYEAHLEALRALPGVLSIEFRLQEVAGLQEALGWASHVRYGLGIFVVFLSAVMVSNAIRIAWYKYHHEVEILRLLGASSLFLKAPFFIEAFIIGVISVLGGVALAWVLLDVLVSRPALHALLDGYEVIFPGLTHVFFITSLVAILSILSSMGTLRSRH
ncbi:cell division protein FtsX [Chrysiogenes arsenatis]|uniref:cell division protein FtsX n=1 Tax=Chrysiogenes arsenatis TaxID=309797 RepID=UPI000420593E|nr:FtsX-like permease family protein [Chrysiogenes arsenatis]